MLEHSAAQRSLLVLKRTQRQFSHHFLTIHVLNYLQRACSDASALPSRNQG